MIEIGRCPITAATLTASSSEGIDSRMSTKRITSVSTLPPMPPAMMPRIAPPIRPRQVETTPMIKDCRAP